MRPIIFFVSLIVLILGVGILTYSISVSGFQLSAGSTISNIGAACVITGVSATTTTTTVGEAQLITFTGQILVRYHPCSESLNQWIVYFWGITNGLRQTPAYFSVFTYNDLGQFSYIIQVPSVATNNWTVVTSLCTNIQGCVLSGISLTSSVNVLTITNPNPTTYASLTFKDASTSHAVTGLVVQVLQASNLASVCQATTGSLGLVVCQGLSSGSYVWNYVDNNNAYGTPSTGSFTITGTPPNPYTQTVMINPSNFNSLRFVDAGTGAGLQNLQVTTSGGGGGSCAGTTTIQGIVQCSSLVAGTTYTWSFTDPTNNYGYPTTGQITPSNVPQTYKLIIMHFALVRAIDSVSAKPLSGIKVAMGTCNSVTNSTGYASCALPAGTYSIALTDPTGVYTTFTGSINLNPLIIVSFQMVLKSGPYIKTIDGNTHAPISGISLSVQTTSGSVVCSGNTNSSGEIQCNGIAIQAYTVYETDSQGRYQSFQATWNASTPIVLALVPNGGGCGSSCPINGAQILQGFALVMTIFGIAGVMIGSALPSSSVAKRF